MKSVTSIRGQPFHDVSGSQKNHNFAAHLRSEGNLLFNTGKLFEALELFNKSLRAAQSNSDDVPLAYADRSAVYFEAKEYQLCLDNIQLAYSAGCPADQLEKLAAREGECKRLLADHEVDPDDDPWNFFKLSYPPNQKIPFIVDCLELAQSDTFGRFVITTQGLADCLSQKS